MNNSLNILNRKIINCTKCDRLVKFRKKIAKEKRKRFIHETYWAKPITGYGDSNAQLLLVGLAPAAHGGTRTGRVFTGDKSAEFLFRCLFKSKLSNQPKSEYKNDGLILYNTYLTPALKCAPPQDKPTAQELKNCFNFFREEIRLLKNIKIIVALGKIAFDACINFYKIDYQIDKKFIFGHGKNYKLPDGKILFSCYHPSPRNVNTKRINISKIVKLLNNAKKNII